MDSILAVQNKIFTFGVKKLFKILGAVVGKACLESQHFNTSSIRDEWHRWKSRPTSEGRYTGSIVTVRTGWMVVVRFFRMLLLSAQCPRPPGRRQNTVWKTFWRTIQRTNNTFWSNGRTSSVFTERSNENLSILQESTTWNFSWLWANRGRNLERR